MRGLFFCPERLWGAVRGFASLKLLRSAESLPRSGPTNNIRPSAPKALSN
jgi:hypothetical protein